MKSLITIFISFSILCSYGQNYNDTKVSLDQQKMLFIDNFNENAQLKKHSKNVVFISQQGDGNLSNIKVKAQKSNISVIQNGDDNKVRLNIQANVVNEVITQIGSGNLFQDYNRSSNNSYNASVYQEGNKQKIYMYGSNSISKNLKIIQKGDYKTIFINNFQ